MNVEDDFQNFTKHLGKIIGEQWSKIKSSPISSSQSEKNYDQEFEEEYETLLREIDYLAAEKSCYLSFLNDNFRKAKSSADLSAILKKHSSEVLKNYAKQHDSEVKHEFLNKRQDLVNYVTEIVVSRNKVCNNKLCSCRPNKVSKEVLTDVSGSPDYRKEAQVGRSLHNFAEHATHVETIQTADQTTSDHGPEKVAITIQTEDWSHDPLCKCGCCPKTGSQIDTKSVITDEKPIQDATTSDTKKITASKHVLANCLGVPVETNTSKRLCVPSNFEKLIGNNKSNQQFSKCSETKDCACDAYDIEEALKRGLELPGSDICIKNKKVKINAKNDKRGLSDDSSDAYGTTDITTSSTDEKKEEKKKNKEEKKKNEEEKKKSKDEKKKIEEENKKNIEEKKKMKEEKKQTKEVTKKENSKSNSGTPRQATSKKNGGVFKCFGPSKKPSKCDEYCLGKIAESRSMQTVLLRTWDKNEEARLNKGKEQRTAQTSTVTEIATQVSAPSSKKDLEDSKQEKDTSHPVDKEQDKGTLLKAGKVEHQESPPDTDNKRARKVRSRKALEDTGDTSYLVDEEDREILPKAVIKQQPETSLGTDNKRARKTRSRKALEDSEAEPPANQGNGESSTSKDARLHFQKDLDDQDKTRDNSDRDSTEKVKDAVCSRCGHLKRNCHTACRKTIIIPYDSNSSRAGEVESLKMLLKMQSRETNRQLDNILTQLNDQKTEVQRLNDMYQKMMENFYEMQSNNSRSQGKRPSDLSRDCRCSNFTMDRRSDIAAKQCGCSVSNECRVTKKLGSSTGKSYNNSVSNNSNNINNAKLPRFGPPNTAVAINRFDVCNVELAGNNVRNSFSPTDTEYQGDDKWIKDQLNQSKKADNSNQYLSTRQENISRGGMGDSHPPKAVSVSTIYKKDDNQGEGPIIDRRSGHENLLDENNDFIKESVETDIFEIETDTSEQYKKPRGIKSSRILIWLKKSWIGIKHRREECRRSEKIKRQQQAFTYMFKFCQHNAKRAGTGLWNAAKYVGNQFQTTDV